MAGLFLPFAPKAKAIEIKAIGIKTVHGLGPYRAVDPRDLAERMGVELISASWFDFSSPSIVASSSTRSVHRGALGHWSSAGVPMCSSTPGTRLNATARPWPRSSSTWRSATAHPS